MLNAVGKPGTMLLLGGTSDIGLEIVREFQPETVILAARDSSPRLAAARQLLEGESGVPGIKVEVVDFDAAATDTHPEILNSIFEVYGDIDVAVVAFGVLGDNEEQWQNQQLAVAAAQVNYTGAVSVGTLLAKHLRAQGHGHIVAISSVAGMKVRRSNFVYGSTKAGFDSFYLQLGEALRGSGVQVLVVRPGQVRTTMTAGMKEAPFTVDAKDVAVAVHRGVLAGKRVVWCHPAFELVTMVLQHLPAAIMRRLPI